MLALQTDCILWGSRVVMPPHGQNDILKELHSEHIGASKMKELARSYVWWPRLNAALENVVQNCQHCYELCSAPPRAELHPWE